MTTPPPAPPRAFSGSRLVWADLPRHVRARIAELAGAPVVTETSATSGFSPGYAAVVELVNGTEVFVKAVSPEQNPHSPDLARAEIAVAQHLPSEVPAPRLLWSDDDGTWVLLGFASVPGRAPEQPWIPEELARVLAALTDLAEAGTPTSAPLPPLSVAMDHYAGCWSRLAADPAALDRAVTGAGPHGPWLRSHLDDLLTWSAQATVAASGDTLVHGDLRADNTMLDPETGQVWLIDWPHATAGGTRWFDLLGMLPSVAMQGGGDPEEIFWAHPNAAGADRADVRAALTALTGYFIHGSVQPPPPGIANLRPFQAAQGVAALEWLRRL